MNFETMLKKEIAKLEKVRANEVEKGIELAEYITRIENVVSTGDLLKIKNKESRVINKIKLIDLQLKGLKEYNQERGC